MQAWVVLERGLLAVFGDPAGNSTALGHNATGTGGWEKVGRVQLLSAIVSLAEPFPRQCCCLHLKQIGGE